MSDDFLIKMSVLLVDDQAESRMQLRAVLEELGVEQIFEASDGKTGMQFMKGACGTMNLILCDWNMPMVSGIEFLQHLRKDGYDTPFLMITGRGDNDSVIEAKNSGVSGYIRKPFTSSQMEAKIRAVMQRAKAA